MTTTMQEKLDKAIEAAQAWLDAGRGDEYAREQVRENIYLARGGVGFDDEIKAAQRDLIRDFG